MEGMEMPPMEDEEKMDDGMENTGEEEAEETDENKVEHGPEGMQ